MTSWMLCDQQVVSAGFISAHASGQLSFHTEQLSFDLLMKKLINDENQQDVHLI